MEMTREIQDALAAEFPNREIKWLPKITTKKGPNNTRVNIERNGQRVAGCMAHIDARQVMNRLDAIVGVGNWSDAYQPAAIGKGVECTLTVCGISKTDVGTVSDQDPEKGAYSDALKRAAVKFGIGRHLYDIETQWLPFDGYKITSKPTNKPVEPPQKKQSTSPLPDDEQVIYEGEAGDFWANVLALIDRYTHIKHAQAAAKKLGYTSVPGKAIDRLEMYRALKVEAAKRDIEEIEVEKK